MKKKKQKKKIGTSSTWFKCSLLYGRSLNTLLYIAVSPDDLKLIDSLFNCIKLWTSENFLQLKQDKT